MFRNKNKNDIKNKYKTVNRTDYMELIHEMITVREINVKMKRYYMKKTSINY